jgi:alpha-galactosidase
MAKIVIIGAGSGFGGRLSIDILSRDAMQDSTIALCDIDAKKLNAVTKYVKRAVRAHKLPAKVQSSTDRRRLLRGADFVVTSIAVGGRAYHGRLHKLERGIPEKYGVVQSVADTIGVGGVFRFLRTAPAQLEFCVDIQRLCPDAIMLNYTNPMAMLSWMHSAASSVQNVGLCHSVQNTIRRVAGYVGLPHEQISYWVAGINHQSWILEFRRNGQDAYPLLRKAMNDPEIYKRDRVRFEMMRHFGYFVTESSGHNSEYVPYFRRTGQLRRKYGLIRNKRRTARNLAMVRKRRRQFLVEYPDESKAPIPELVRSAEYASGIMEAVVTNTPFRFNGNITNNGLVTNLPQGCCVEIPCIADGEGVHGCHVGNLPPQCAAINRSNIAVQELAVRAFLDHDKEAAFHAVALDPLTASLLPLDKIRQMFEELWKAEKPLLRYFD